MTEPKVTKADVLEKSEGMLQKHLYVVFTSPTNGIGPVLDNIKEHLDFQISLEERGIMFGAGPFWEDNERDWLGHGMVIIRADNLEHAKQIAAEDPMHASGARSFTVKPWLMNEGTLTIKLRYSDGSREVI
jgi:uncharacterized protein YciI